MTVYRIRNLILEELEAETADNSETFQSREMAYNNAIMKLEQERRKKSIELAKLNTQITSLIEERDHGAL